jgi:hypothetical protein
MTISAILFYSGILIFLGLWIFLRFTAPLFHFSWQASFVQWLAFAGTVMFLFSIFTWFIL